MNTVSRTIAGIGAIVIGAVLIFFALVNEIWLLVYGLPAFVLGFFILFNKKEDEIEQIKKSKDK